MIVPHKSTRSHTRLAAVALLCLPLVLAACGSNKPAAPAEQTPAASGAKPLAEPETPAATAARV